MARSAHAPKTGSPPTSESFEQVLKDLPTGVYILVVGLLFCHAAAWLFRFDMEVAVAPEGDRSTAAWRKLAGGGDMRIILFDRWTRDAKVLKALNF